MRKTWSTLITVSLIPILFIYFLAPRINQAALRELLARQPAEVCSFVWMPLLEISLLIIQKVLPSDTIAPTPASEAAGQQKPQTPTNNENFLFLIIPTGIVLAMVLRFLLPLLKLWQDHYAEDPSVNPAQRYVVSPCSPLQLLTILRSNPALARGEPPLSMPVVA